MPIASPSQHQSNLERLAANLSPHCPHEQPRLDDAKRWAERLPLVHSTSQGSFSQILGDEHLLSHVQSGVRPGNAEKLLGTSDDVFLYLGAFAYPNTECGFLFMPSLEELHSHEAVATPFDSGAMAYRVNPPPSYADGVSFVRAHELPVPGYRVYLAQIIGFRSSSPENFVRDPKSECSCGELLPHPLGLVQDDRRRSTFELRIPQRVALSKPHLTAVFVCEGQIAPESKRALAKLHASGVTIQEYPADDGLDFFQAMQSACVSFILDHLAS